MDASFVDRQMLGLAGAVDVLEEGEAIDPELEAAALQEAPEALHEEAQHLVDIHDHQRTGQIHAHVGKIRRARR